MLTNFKLKSWLKKYYYFISNRSYASNLLFYLEFLKIFYSIKISQRKYVPIKGPINYNRILDNSARSQYKPVIEQMVSYIPQRMKRKIFDANVQQAFILDTVIRFASQIKNPKILCVGSYEDTAAICLKMIGYNIIEIDPLINYDLDTYSNLPSTKIGSFDIIFSTSVIEHVDNDQLFIIQIENLLKNGGIAILTCDFNNNYQMGDQLPHSVLRFYTKSDILNRILNNIPNCNLIDEPDWESKCNDFYHDDCYYTFASIVFQKGDSKLDFKR